MLLLMEQKVSKRLFGVGQAIICINDDFRWARKNYPGLSYPTFGSRYIVRAYVVDGNCPAIVLQEIRNRDVVYLSGKIYEAGFADKRFVGAPPEPFTVTMTLRKKEKETC